MVAYRWIYDAIHFTSVCTPGSPPGPTLDNEYGEVYFTFFKLQATLMSNRCTYCCIDSLSPLVLNVFVLSRLTETFHHTLVDYTLCFIFATFFCPVSIFSKYTVSQKMHTFLLLL